MDDNPKKYLIQRVETDKRHKSSKKKAPSGYSKLTTYDEVVNYLLEM